MPANSAVRPMDNTPLLIELAGYRLAQIRPGGEKNLHGMGEEGLLAVVEAGLGHGFELLVQ